MKDLAVVLQAFEIPAAAYPRWRNGYGGIKLEESNLLKDLENENRRLQKLLSNADRNILMLKEPLRGID
ncbi:hypothetical protein [Pirellula sp. SH-Sr6A]|uniref:hypothetical protein n=1 Tax=Pirellula sp. SH-Sr6A TaxID=1632865 RepID=UPI0011BA6CB6|nr:hypothetical protein [Pirellula sp. SH-Sr6A]